MSIDQFVDCLPLQTTSQSHTKSLRYLGLLLAIQGLLYVPPFFVVRLPIYQKVSMNFDFPSLDFGFRAAGQNADIVIYGDSSAKHGIDPSQMSTELGVKVLDIPGSRSLMFIADDLPLRRYVHADKPPRLIILYFTAWSLDYGHESFDSAPPYDGMEMLLRYGTGKEILAFFKSHPADLIQFPLMFYRANVVGLFRSRALIRKQAQQVEESNGYTETPVGLHDASTCVIPSSLIDGIRFDWVHEMSDRYRSAKTKVLVYIAPIPACTNAQSVVDHPYSVLAAAPPKTMPPSLFLDDNNFSHLDPAGVPQATESLIEAVRPSLTALRPKGSFGRD